MTRLLPLAAAVLAIAFAWVVPLGESPDELAHLRYAEALATGRLPVLWKGDAHGYEAHQPPLGYVLPALVLAVAGGVEVVPVANTRFDFHTPGSRAFLPPFADARDRLVLRLARSTQAFWAALTVWAGLALCGGRLAALPFLLAPQLLFVCGAINNDAALIAVVSCTLLLLVRFAANGRHSIAIGLLVTAALFTKGSALFLLVPVTVACAIARPAPLAPTAATTPMPRRNRRARFAPPVVLLTVTAAGLAAWAAFNFARFGSLLPPVPTASHVATLSELLREPRWIGGLFRSFWAKFGMLNTPLPWPFYLWFAALSGAVVVGVRRLAGSQRLVLASALLANAGLVLAYQLTVDLQAQGRYLLPSLAAVAAFGSAGLAALPARLQPVLFWGAVVVALAAIAATAMAYS